MCELHILKFLKGFGVGNASASATHALLMTVLQDVFGRMTSQSLHHEFNVIVLMMLSATLSHCWSALSRDITISRGEDVSPACGHIE